MDNRRAGQATSSDTPSAGEGSGSWDRRGVLKAAGAAAAAGSVLGASVAQAAPTLAVSPLYKVVADTRFADSRAFAAEAAHAGQRIAWTDGDVTNLWYHELDLLWRGDKAALAGLTEHAAFFCLERLALDRGLRVVFKGEHRRLASGAVAHAVAGPDAVVTKAALERLSGRAWAAQAASMALDTRGAGPIGARRQAISPSGPSQPLLLISWVLAAKSERRI